MGGDREEEETRWKEGKRLQTSAPLLKAVLLRLRKKKLYEETKEGIKKEKTSCVWMEFYFKVHIDPDRIVTSGM